MRGEPGKPKLFLRNLGRIRRITWQSGEKIPTNSKGPIIPTLRVRWHNRQTSPLWKLLADEAANKFHVDIACIHKRLRGSHSPCIREAMEDNDRVGSTSAVRDAGQERPVLSKTDSPISHGDHDLPMQRLASIPKARCVNG
jgi:hypothetical protein